MFRLIDPLFAFGSTKPLLIISLKGIVDYAQGDRDSMNREANIAVKILADTNN